MGLWGRWLVLLALLLLPACGDGGGGSDKDGKNGDDGRPADGSSKNDLGPGNTTPSFRYNSEKCKLAGPPRSAVTTKVGGAQEMLDQYASLLEQEGYQVFRGPQEPAEQPDSISEADVAVPSDRPAEWGDSAAVQDAPQPQDLEAADVTEGWTGGEYVVALTPLSDLIFLTEEGTLGVASWCPANNLGQIRRLDYTLADAIHIWAELNGWDYAAETKKWVDPAAYYTTVAGSYQRSYVSESLDLNESHAGQLSVGGKIDMAAVALYGHADSPSNVGDVVGMDLLQIGQSIVAENDTVIASAQVVRLWDISDLVSVGENPITVDPFVQDASINFVVGIYRLFADAVFLDGDTGSVVLALQGAPPGKLVVSKGVDVLALPPTSPLF